MRRFIITAGLSLFWAFGLSYAQSYSEAETALVTGEYAKAAELGAVLKTADSLALAAEAINAQIMLCQTEKPKKRAKQARKLASKALEIDPKNANALLQYALAQGFATRRSSPISVWRKKMPEKLKDSISAYEKVSPDDARVDAFLGAWHFGIVQRAGEKRAQDWYDATAEDGIAAYKRALEASPGDIIISSNYALSILVNNPDKHGREAKEILQNISDAKTKSALEKDLQDLMNETLKHLNGDTPDYETAVDSATVFLDGGL